MLIPLLHTSAQTYCNFGGYANPGAGLGNYITNVSITNGSINNSSSGTDGSFNDYTGNTDGAVTKGSSYSSSVTYNKSAWTSYLGVYIDWNDDGDFADANEVIVNNATLSTGSGTGTYTFTINVPSGASTATVRMRVYDNNSAAGSCAFAYGEAEDYEIVVSAVSGPTADAGNNQSICTGASVNIGGSPTATGGTSPFTYSWGSNPSGFSSTAANPSVSPTTTTTYTVTVTDNASHTATDNVIVTVNAVPTANAGSDVAICNGTSTNLTATGGGTYLWNTSSTTQQINVSPSSTTTYTVTVTTNNCTATNAVVVSVNAVPTANAGSDVAIYNGTSTNLTATGGGTYIWNTSSTTQQINVSPSSTTTYTVTVTTNNCTATDNVSVTVAQPLSLTGATRCGAGQVSLTVNAQSGTFNWYTQATGGTAVHTGLSYTPTVSSTTTYYVEQQSSTSGQVGITTQPTSSAQIWDGYTRVFSTSSNTMNFTTSQANVTLTSVDIWTGSASQSYLSNFWVTIEDNSSNVIYTSSTYSIQSSYPTSNSKYQTVALNTNLSNAGQYKMRIYCNAQADAWGQFGYGGITFPLTDANNIITLNSGFDIFTNIQFQSTGASGSCPRNSVVATVNTIPTADAGSDQSICLGNQATLSATGGTSYSWNTNATTQQINVSPTSTITYTVTVTNNECTASDNVVVTVSTIITASAGADVSVYEGTQITLSANGGTSYAWSTNEITASITVSPTQTTTYIVTATQNNCTATDEVVVTVFPLPTGNCTQGCTYMTFPGTENRTFNLGANQKLCIVSGTTDFTGTVNTTGSGWDIENCGTVKDAATINLNASNTGTINNFGTWNNALAGTEKLETGTVFNNKQDAIVSIASAEVKGILNNEGAISISNGLIISHADAVLNNNAGTITITGMSAQQSNIVFTGAGTINNNAQITLTSQLMNIYFLSNDCRINNNATGSITLSAGTTAIEYYNNNPRIVNAGNFIISNSNIGISASGRGVLTNTNMFTINSLSNGFYINGDHMTIDNSGTLNITSTNNALFLNQ